MVNRPSVPEIITVNSEELQTLIRDLLPSQNGFGSELQATNVITPIIDLTATAEGSTLRPDLQTSLSFANITSFNIAGAVTTLANSPGFWRFYGVSTLTGPAAAAVTTRFQMTDGLSTKVLWDHSNLSAGETGSAVNFDFVVFLRPGESVSGTSSNAFGPLTGTYRQIATGDGTLVNPTGYPL